MFEKNDKRYLYYLIDSYLKNKIDEVALCDGIYYSFVHEIDNSKLSDRELEAFSALEKVTSRFSEFEEDHALDPNAFSTKEDLRQVAEKVWGKLKDEYPMSD